MKKIIFALFALSALNVFGSSEPQTTVVQIERVQANENTAMIRVKGVKKMLIIPQLTDFSEAQLNKLNESQANGASVNLKINSQNQIIDIK